MYDVVTVGSATLDVFVYTELPDMDGTRKLVSYPAGSKILIKKLGFMTGGGGTNTAVSFSRLGLKTAYLGKLGTDDTGRRIVEQLKTEGVSFVGPRGKKDFTAYSVILDSKGHDRTILTYKGIANHLDFREIDKKKLKTKWFYLSSLMGKSFQTQKKLCLYAKKKKIKVAYNPSDYQIKRSDVSYLLKRSDVLVFNRREAGLLTGKNDIKGQMKKISKMGPGIICITDGPHGDYTYDVRTGDFYSMKPHRINIKERTGAGDAFASSFVTGLIKKDIEFAMKLALVNAESVVMYHGAKNKLLTYREAVRKIKSNPVKVKKERL
ncbi:MAG: carbohydrate kinase family protein [archaeon]|nr:MAG: carbohydrate kinase family protein [archaeon]